MAKKLRIHLIGIGGIGMSGIARVLLNQGHRVSGSDLTPSATTEELQKLGAEIHIGHKAEQAKNKDLVVYSAAIRKNNPELVQARSNGAEILSRAEMLAKLMEEKKTRVTVTGAHGKTTTSSMIAHVLASAGKDPTAIIGGKLQSFGGNTRLGTSDLIVAETDESDGTFTLVSPTLAVITYVDDEHMESFGSRDAMEKAYVDYAMKTPKSGAVFLGVDSARCHRFLERLPGKKLIPYGLDEKAKLRATDLETRGMGSRFLVSSNGKRLGELSLRVPGRHNVANALCTAGVAMELGVTWKEIAESLAAFEGLRRRFQIHLDSDIMIVDDYGHHPTEIEANLRACREGWPGRRLVIAVQPHRYTRLRDHFDGFSACLGAADAAILLDVYPASEDPIPGVNSATLYEKTRERRPRLQLHHTPTLQNAFDRLIKTLKPGDILMVFGAGDSWKLSEMLRSALGGE